ncbi:MAG: hypothetical protein IT285_08865 [Bdellovibrionales bacterium]|nr:hypothetical protein [Bdellovibrionales bacterium]
MSYRGGSGRKQGLFWAHLALVFLGAALAAAGKADAASLGFSLEPQESRELSVRAVDELTAQPLTDARVDITTLGAGGPTQITASREGYTAVTVVGVRTGRLTIQLRALGEGASPAVVRGQLGGWKAPAFGSVSAGAVFRPVSASNLLHFRQADFISPLKDSVDILGPREIPSNVVMPRQTVYTPMGPVSVNKETWRLPLERGARLKLVGVQGEAAVSDLLLAYQSGKFTVDLLNQLRFRRLGMSAEFTAEEGRVLNFSGTTDLRSRHRVSPSQPPFAADVLVVAMTDLDGSRRTLIPTDLKAAMNHENPAGLKSVQLVTPAPAMGTEHVVTVA